MVKKNLYDKQNLVLKKYDDSNSAYKINESGKTYYVGQDKKYYLKYDNEKSVYSITDEGEPISKVHKNIIYKGD